MLRIAICDDDQAFLSLTVSVIGQWKNKPLDLILETFDNEDSLVLSHNETPFDIVFLDMLMPQINGLETARKIRELDKTVKIVFLTSSAEYAVDSYTVKADNYLLKPFDPDRLFQCLDELTAELNLSGNSILVKGLRTLHKIELPNIEYIEAQNKRVLFYLCDGRTQEAIEPLYTYEEKFKDLNQFFKCHRSYIINIHHIESYSSKEIKMRSGCRIPISRNCTREFEEAYFSIHSMN